MLRPQTLRPPVCRATHRQRRWKAAPSGWGASHLLGTPSVSWSCTYRMDLCPAAADCVCCALLPQSSPRPGCSQHDHESSPGPGCLATTPCLVLAAGNLIIRAALSQDAMQPFLQYLWMFLSISGPHLGYLTPSNKLFSSGLWLLKTCSRQGED